MNENFGVFSIWLSMDDISDFYTEIGTLAMLWWGGVELPCALEGVASEEKLKGVVRMCEEYLGTGNILWRRWKGC
jgi:hypothetical protein